MVEDYFRADTNEIPAYHLFSQLRTKSVDKNHINYFTHIKTTRQSFSIKKELIDCVYKSLLVIKMLCTKGLFVLRMKSEQIFPADVEVMLKSV